MKIKINNSFKRRIVLENVSFLVEQNCVSNTITIIKKSNNEMIYEYSMEHGLKLNEKYITEIEKIFVLSHIDRFPIE